MAKAGHGWPMERQPRDSGIWEDAMGRRQEGSDNKAEPTGPQAPGRREVSGGNRMVATGATEPRRRHLGAGHRTAAPKRRQ